MLRVNLCEHKSASDQLSKTYKCFFGEMFSLDLKMRFEVDHKLITNVFRTDRCQGVH